MEASAIESVLDFMVGIQNCQRKRYGHERLYRQVAEVYRSHVDPHGRFFFEDAKGLKSYLLSNQDLLRKRWGLVWDKTGKNHYWQFNSTQEQIEAAAERLELNSIQGQDRWKLGPEDVDGPFGGQAAAGAGVLGSSLGEMGIHWGNIPRLKPF